MTNANVPTKRELLDLLRAQATQVEDAVRRLSEQQLEEGRYEGGWNARQILAHVAAIEWTYPRLIDLAKGSDESAPPRTSAPAATPGGQPPSGAAPSPEAPVAAVNPIDSYNARQVEKRATMSVAELLDEFRTNRAALIAAVEAADDALFDVPIRSAGGARGPLASVIKFVALDHVGVHVRDLTGETA